jgi:hypothetical protein
MRTGQAGAVLKRHGVMTSLTERLDGPSAIAIWGSDEPGDKFRFGTRELDWHHHLRGQLFCIESGLIRVHTKYGSWLLPPQRIGWLPPRLKHKVTMSGVLSGWGVLLTPAASKTLPDQPCVMGGSELLRALVRRAASWTNADRLTSEQGRVVAVLLDEIRNAQREALHLPMPTDLRALRIANTLIKRPDDARTLQELAEAAGLSERTARRVFAAETGMSFTQWRQQARSRWRWNGWPAMNPSRMWPKRLAMLRPATSSRCFVAPSVSRQRVILPDNVGHAARADLDQTISSADQPNDSAQQSPLSPHRSTFPILSAQPDALTLSATKK